jgi:hypothetical protein
MLRLECIAAARRSVHKQFGWKCPHPSTYRYFDALHESISCATTLFRHTAALLEKLFSRSRLCDWLGVLQVWDDAPEYPIIEPHLTSALEACFEID